MFPNLERRKFLGTALHLIPGFHILKALPTHELAEPPRQTPDMNAIDHQTLLMMVNAENWFARHAEHCVKRIIWSGSISDWFEQLDQHLDRFNEAFVGADGGPGILISRAQMDLLSWQTRVSSGKAPCQTRLFVSTMYLLYRTVTCFAVCSQSSITIFAAALKTKHPALHTALVAALHELNIDEVLQFVDSCPEREDVFHPSTERDYVKHVASTIKEMILALLNTECVSPE